MNQDQWRKLYNDAVVETNFDTLGERVRAAEKAISERSSLNGEVSAEERRELQDSRNSLADLNEERTQGQSNSGRNEFPDVSD